MNKLKYYIYIARPDHWFKNIFMLPGIALAIVFAPQFSFSDYLYQIILAIFSACMIASANYVINEWLDAEFDRHHPVKKDRATVQGHIVGFWVYIEWTLLALAGLGSAMLISKQFFFFSLIFLVMGILYNVRPMRTKDRMYLDVLSEAINNPLRLLLGWSAILDSNLPPSSILISYWMGGAFLMGIKRYGEYRYIDNPETAGLYRRSFRFYTEEKLLLSSFFYALTSSLFLGVFLVKYRIEFLLSFPFFAILFTWYLHIGMSEDSTVQRPEKLYQQKSFLLFLFFLGALVSVLFFVDIPWLDTLLEVNQY